MNGAEKHVVVVGSLNADFVVTARRLPRPGETLPGSSFTRFPGGKGANQAVGAARLAAGPGARGNVRVSMIGQVGADDHGGWLRAGLEAAGVDVEGVGVDRGIGTGAAVIVVDAAGQNQIVVVPGANGTLEPEILRGQLARLASADLVLLQLEIPLATVELAARVAGAERALVILDPAPACPLADALLAACDYVTPNEGELHALALPGGTPSGDLSVEDARAAARRLLGRGARRVIVKLGGRGALLVAPEVERRWPPFAVDSIDSTAAGDAFNAAFAVALAEGATEDDAGRLACAAAALSVTRRGAQTSLPTRSAVAAFLEGRVMQPTVLARPKR